MSDETINLRQTSYAGYETLANNAATLSDSQVDSNWIGLYQRLYDVMPVGVTLPYLGSDKPSGWVIADGSTIGDASSTADSGSALYIRLFTLLWNQCVANPATALSAYDHSGSAINFSSSPVSASTAWTGHYKIALPNLQDVFPIGISSAGLSTAFNMRGGAKTVDSSHTHTNNIVLSTVAAHNHGTVSGTTSSAGGFTPTGSITMNAVSDHTHAFVSAPHTHTLDTTTHSFGEGATAGIITVTAESFTVTGANASAGGHTPTGSFTGNAVSGHTHTFSGTMSDAGSHTHTISSGGVQSGGSTTLSIVPPFYGLNFIIKYSWGL